LHETEAVNIMTVAITTWNGRVSPVLDVARQIELLEADGGQIAGRRLATLPGTSFQHQAESLLALHPEVLICGAVSRPLADLLTTGGVKLIPFTAGETDPVVQAWLTGTLPNPAMTMPGCCGRRMGWCGRGRGHGPGRGRGRRHLAT
jgi:predicted Fe-Mo cluster-binding NifX family protein